MKSETKLFLGIIVGTIAIVGVGIALLSKPTQSQPVNPAILIRADSHTIATASASVTLVEFSDFQCPACGAYYPVVQQVVNKFKGTMTFVYRNFPLTSIHPNAQIAAQAAEAADLQGKYWEMHDLLFTKQNDWAPSKSPKDIFVQYAETLGLNTDQFMRDIDADTVKNKVRQDIDDGNILGVSATPTFFLNNRKIENPASLADFETALEAAMSQK